MLNYNTPPTLSRLDRHPQLALHAFGQRPAATWSAHRSSPPWRDIPAGKVVPGQLLPLATLSPCSTTQYPSRGAASCHEDAYAPAASWGWADSIQEADSEASQPADRLGAASKALGKGLLPAGHDDDDILTPAEDISRSGSFRRGSWAERRGSYKPTYKRRFARMRWAMLRKQLPEILKAERAKRSQPNWQKALSHLKEREAEEALHALPSLHGLPEELLQVLLLSSK